MKKKSKYPFVIVLSALSAVLAVTMLSYGCGNTLEGKLAPQLAGKDRTGKDFNLQNTRGKAVILYFWSTWAPPSRLGLSQMVRVQSDFRKRNLVVVGVAIREEARPLARFIKEVPVNFPIVMGTTTIEDSYFGKEGVKLPMTIMLDGNGVVREHITGYQSREDLVPLIEKMADLTR